MFVYFNNKIINTNTITNIDCKNFPECGSVQVYYYNQNQESVIGVDAITLIMTLCPAVLEGKRAKYIRHSWAIHNLIGHPLMQIFSWLHCYKLAMWFHDITTPEPLIENE